MGGSAGFVCLSRDEDNRREDGTKVAETGRVFVAKRGESIATQNEVYFELISRLERSGQSEGRSGSWVHARLLGNR